MQNMRLNQANLPDEERRKHAEDMIMKIAQMLGEEGE